MLNDFFYLTHFRLHRFCVHHFLRSIPFEKYVTVLIHVFVDRKVSRKVNLPPPFFTGSCPFQGSTASNKKCFEFFSIVIFQKYSLEKLYFLRNILDPLYLVRMPVHHMRYFRIHNRNHSKISGMTVFLYLDGLLFKHKLSILQQSCKDMCIGFGLLIKIEHPYFVLRKHTVLHNRVL